MAKIAYSKLKLKTNEEITNLQLTDDITIEVKKYLPIQEKLALIGRVVMAAHEQDNNYSNPVKVNVYTDLEIVFAYTNLAFTDKQLEDTAKLYDQLQSSGILTKIKNAISPAEEIMIRNGVQDSIEAVYSYQNSALGILDGIQKGYSQEQFDVDALKESVKDLADSPLVKEIMPLLGLE